MALGLLGIIVLLVVGGLVLAAILIPVFLFASRRERGEEGPLGGLIAVVGSCGALAVIGLIVLVGVAFLGFFVFHGTRAGQPQTLTVPLGLGPEAPVADVVMADRPATEAVPAKFQLGLRAAEDGAAKGQLELEVLNQTGKPVAPASLNARPGAGPWYVEIIGKASSDLVTWNEEDKGRGVGHGEKSSFRIRVPLNDLGAEPDDEIRIYYQESPGSGEAIIRSNKIRVPGSRGPRPSAPVETR